jgi:plasmid stabilization system protein ParE
MIFRKALSLYPVYPYRSENVAAISEISGIFRQVRRGQKQRYSGSSPCTSTPQCGYLETQTHHMARTPRNKSQIIIAAIRQKIKSKKDDIQRLEDEVKNLENQLEILESRPDFLATILEALPDTKD